jgi:hypothetical protein
MGSVVRFFDKKIVEPFIEKPIKKIGRETVDVLTGMDKTDRRPPPTPEPEVTPEVTPEVIPDETIIAGRGTRRTKRAGQAGTIMEEYGAISAKPIKKAVERA